MGPRQDSGREVGLEVDVVEDLALAGGVLEVHALELDLACGQQRCKQTGGWRYPNEEAGLSDRHVPASVPVSVSVSVSVSGSKGQAFELRDLLSARPPRVDRGLAVDHLV